MENGGGGNGEEKNEYCGREGGKLKNGRKKKFGNEERTFFFFAFHFSKRQKFVLGLPKQKFSTGKKQMNLPLRKIFLLCPCFTAMLICSDHCCTALYETYVASQCNLNV